MIGLFPQLHRGVLQSARTLAFAAGALALACLLAAGPAAADWRRAAAAPPALAADVAALADARPLGRAGWRGAGGSAYRGFAGAMRPASFSWAVQARQQRLYQTIQGFGGGGGRWGWRGGGRGGGYGRFGGGGRGGFQPPDAAANALRNQGYSNVNPLTRRGRSYVGEATGPQGQRQRVIIDGRSGRVMGASPLGPPVVVAPPGAGWYGGY